MTRICHRVIALLLGCALLAGAGCAAAEKTVTISFTGDCTLGSEEVRAAGFTKSQGDIIKLNGLS